jgi:hypothetical protein
MSTDIYKQILNPLLWDKEISDAWHTSIPDVNKAFESIRNIAEKRASIKGEDLGLPWEDKDIESMCPVCMEPIFFHKEKADFILKACNHHHALIEALENITEALKRTDTSSMVYLWEPIEEAKKALESIK